MRKGGLKNWLLLVGAVLVGTQFAPQIKEALKKVPVIGDFFNKTAK